MAVNTSRSQSSSLHDGMSEGIYRRARPDTELILGMSNVHMRDHLSPVLYGDVTREIPQGYRELADGTVC